MTDIHDLLERAVDDVIDVDVDADVRRGHRARTRGRTRLVAGVAGGLVAVSAAGYAALPSHPATEQITTPSAEPAAPLVHTDFFDLATPPVGWHLVGAKPSYVMIARDDSGAQLDDVFTGRLMILLEDKSFPMDYGTTVPYNGRTFYDNEQGGDAMSILSVQDPSGDWVQAQYPQSAGFDREAMVTFLDSVVVGPGAVGTRG